MNGSGLRLYNLEENGIGKLARWLLSEEISVFHPPSSLFHHFIDTLEGDQYFPCLRQINLGGEPLYQHDLDKLWVHVAPQCLVKYSFASTEGGVLAQRFIGSETILDRRLIKVGYPIPEKIVRVVDDDGLPQINGESGDIVVQSRFIADGY